MAKMTPTIRKEAKTTPMSSLPEGEGEIRQLNREKILPRVDKKGCFRDSCMCLKVLKVVPSWCQTS